MSATRRQALVLAAGMGATAALAACLRPARREPDAAHRVQLDALFPDRFGTWTLDRDAASFVRAADRRGQQTQVYDQVLERSFVQAGGARVMLSVAYLDAQSSDLQLHRPEVCYRAGGFRVSALRDATLRVDRHTLPVTLLVAEMPGRPEPVTYWTVVDGRVGADTSLPWWRRLQRAAQRRDADAVLVRISSIDPQPARAYGLHAVFAADLARALSPSGQALVLGTTAPA